MTAVPALEFYDKIFPDKELIRLYHRIETALPNMNSRVVQFVSCHFGEGATAIGQELAMLASGTLNCPTLFIGPEVSEKMSRKASNMNDRPAEHARASLLDVVTGHAQIPDMLTKVSDETSSYDRAYLAPLEKTHDIQSDMERLKQVMGFLRERFRLIIISTPGVLSDPTMLRLGPLADGAVFVVEAERTRSPAAMRALRDIHITGTRAIGIVFNKRRYHIPRWLYRLI